MNSDAPAIVSWSIIPPSARPQGGQTKQQKQGSRAKRNRRCEYGLFANCAKPQVLSFAPYYFIQRLSLSFASGTMSFSSISFILISLLSIFNFCLSQHWLTARNRHCLACFIALLYAAKNSLCNILR